MSHTDPPSVTGIHLVERSAKSLSLSWSVSRRANPSTIRYKLMYCEKVRSLVITDHNFDYQWLYFLTNFWTLQDKDEAKTGKTYTVLVLDKNSVQISDLSPSTVYLFQVQALSSEGTVGSNSVEKEFSTLPEGKCQTERKPMKFYCVVKSYTDLHFYTWKWYIWCDGNVGLVFNSDSPVMYFFTVGNTAVILGAVAGGGAILFIVLVVLLLRKRSETISLPYTVALSLSLGSFMTPSAFLCMIQDVQIHSVSSFS